MSLVVGGVAMVTACGRGEATRRSGRAPSDRVAIERAQRPDRLVAHLGLRPGSQVADVGAGAGLLEPHLMRAVGPRGRVVATDVDPVAVAALARLADSDPDRLEPRWVTTDDPGLEPQRFDVVVLARVDHLLADRAAFLSRLRRALAPGGRIAVANRIDREAALQRAVGPAGLRVVATHRDLPAQFVVLLAPEGRP